MLSPACADTMFCGPLYVLPSVYVMLVGPPYAYTRNAASLPLKVAASSAVEAGLPVPILVNESPRFAVPFAVVSASDDYKILQDCFKKGARDFFVKPVNKNEILFKINRILNDKGQSNVALAKPRFKDLTLDTFTQTVTRENVQKIIQLTQTEYKILALFFRNPERRLNREEIIGEVWKSEALSPKACDFHLSKLREKLRELSVKINYQTNEGYCLIQE